ncbi:lipase 3-like [Bradysia coprophila]|uniref:lipase 3-like n=1 Tax=Bradysia coprophila TaxID=38358 RepID=UPI00187DC417|nr:lipase 3-like [Bradysia coprophila]
MHFGYLLSATFLTCLEPWLIGARGVKNPLLKTMCNLKTDQLIKYYGYDAERHEVTTEDGYILTIFRCNSKNSTQQSKPPVIVQHGILVSSDDFCISPPGQSLAYVLADSGYDVWLANSRGNVYSRRHKTKDPNSWSGDFWNFSWLEMGIYDHPAVIDYILYKTGHSKLYYLGHSQGTTNLLVLLSERPEYNQKIYAASLMAPAVYFSHMEVLTSILALVPAAVNYLESIPNTEVFPRDRLFTEDFNTFCTDNLAFCDLWLDLITGPSENQRNETMMPIFMCHNPSGTSLRQIVHYYQTIKFGTFAKYKNGKEIPSDFELSRITAPISLHMSVSDMLTKLSDGLKLVPKLNNSEVFVHIINGTKLNHVDFAWGMNSAKIVYSEIIKFFRKHQN